MARQEGQNQQLRKAPIDPEVMPFKTLLKEELNLCEFPFAALSYQKTFKPLEFSDVIEVHKGAGRYIQRKWLVDGSLKHGIPIAPDEDVVMGMFYLTLQGNYLDLNRREVPYRTSELLKAINWPVEGRYINVFRKGSLFRLFGCKITTENAFYDIKQKKVLEKGYGETIGFGILDNFYCRGRKTGNKEHDEHVWDKDFNVWQWNETIWKSMLAGNLKTTDFGFYLSLQRPGAKRLFRYADKVFNREGTIRMNVKTLGNEHIGMSRTYNLAQLKRKLKLYTDELVDKGFIKSPFFLGSKKDVIVIEPVPKKMSLNHKPRLLEPLSAQGLVARFLDKFHHKREPLDQEILQAQDLINRYGREAAKYIVDSATDKAIDVFKNPTEFFGGLLAFEKEAIEQYYQEERKNKRAEELAAKKKAEEEERLRVEKENEYFLYIFAKLPESRQEVLKNEALQRIRGRGIQEQLIFPLLIEAEIIDIFREQKLQAGSKILPDQEA